MSDLPAQPLRPIGAKPLMGDLKRRTISGATVTLMAQGLKIGIGMASTMVLARLLSPDDYGLVAMVTAITGFVGIIGDGGLSVATVQRDQIDHAQVSNLFWINTVMSALMGVVVLVCSPLVGWFYHDPRLTWVTVAMSAPFFIGGIAVQHRALLQREMRFTALAAIDVSAIVVSLATGVALALAGWNYWALVGMTIANSLCTCVSVWFISSWRPSLPRRNTGVGSMLRFGGSLTLCSLLSMITNAVDKLLLGKFVGTASVGLYSRAQNLMLQPFQQIMPTMQTVGLPLLSRLASQPERFRSTYLDLLRLSVFASSFLASMLIANADLIVNICLGSKWMESVGIFRYFAIPVFTAPLTTVCVMNLTARGDQSSLIRWWTLNSVVSIIAIGIGLAWGTQGVAAAISLSGLCIRVPLLYYFVEKKWPDRVVSTWSIAGTGILLFGSMTLILSIMRLFPVFANPLAQLAWMGMVNVVIHGLTLLLMPFGRNIIRIVKSLRPASLRSPNPVAQA